MVITLWDKKSSINGVDYERAIESQPELGFEKEVLLISQIEGGRIEKIEIGSKIRSDLGINTSIDADAMIALYQEHLKLEEQEKITLLEKVTQLETDNANINYVLMMGGLI